MKINFFLLFIALAICGLVFFGFYNWTDNNLLYTSVSAGVSLFFLVPTIALTWPEHPRGTTMAKVLSGLVFVVALVANILLARYEVSSTTFIIVNGALFCIWAGLCYGITSAKQ